MKQRPRKIGILAAATGMLLAVSPGAQVTGGQARAAQSPAAQSAPAQAAPARPAQAPPPASSAGAARRDPFRPLVSKEKTAALPVRLPPGKPGLVIGQLTLQGIVRGLNGQWIAVVDNKTNRAYFLFPGDELYNGRVNRITEDSVVFDERVNDASGRPGTREVVKQLNPS